MMAPFAHPRADRPGSAPASVCLEEGAIVMLRNLRGRPHLNGCLGRVTASESGPGREVRYQVLLHGINETLALPPEKLFVQNGMSWNLQTPSLVHGEGSPVSKELLCKWTSAQKENAQASKVPVEHVTPLEKDVPCKDAHLLRGVGSSLVGAVLISPRLPSNRSHGPDDRDFSASSRHSAPQYHTPSGGPVESAISPRRRWGPLLHGNEELDAGFLCSSHENEVSPRSRGNRFVVGHSDGQVEGAARCAVSTWEPMQVGWACDVSRGSDNGAVCTGCPEFRQLRTNATLGGFEREHEMNRSFTPNEVLARKSQTQCVDPQVPLLGASAPCALSKTMSINELRDRILLKAEAAEPLLGVSRHELLSGHLPKLASPRSEQQSRMCTPRVLNFNREEHGDRYVQMPPVSAFRVEPKPYHVRTALDPACGETTPEAYHLRTDDAQRRKDDAFSPPQAYHLRSEGAQRRIDAFTEP